MRRRDVRTLLLSGALLTTVGLVARMAHADTKQACIESHEESQFLRRQGKLQAERDKLLVCSQDACPEILRVACVQWLERTLADVPTIVLEARDDTGPVNDVKVTIDGQPGRDSLDGRAQPIDPGDHVFRFTNKKGASRDVKIVVAQGQKNKIVSAEFGEPKKNTAAVDLAELDAIAAQRSRRTVGLVVGGIGVAALATGVVFGFFALNASDDARCTSPCPARDKNGVTNPKLSEAQSNYDQSQTFAWVSNIGLAAGVVGIGIGTYLVLTSGSKSAKPQTGWLAPTPLPSGAGFSFGGAL